MIAGGAPSRAAPHVPWNDGVAMSMALAQVEALRRLAREFSPDSADRKQRMLTDLAAMAIDDPATLLAWHDLLLLLLAYPQTPALREACEAELVAVADRVQRLVAANDGEVPDALYGSGLAGARLAVTFNHQVSRWLCDRFPAQSGLGAVRGDISAVRAVLRESFPAIEFEALAADAETADAYLDELGADRAPSRLRWLLDAVDAVPASPSIRRRLWNDLDAFVRVSSTPRALSRATLRGLDHPVYFHDAPLQRAEDARAILDAPLLPQLALAAPDRDRLLTAARGLLALLGRQTEPISDCDGDGVHAFDLGRGVVIGLFSASPADRPPLDSHIGMMLFKNGLPVAYGGGWPFLGVCKIGINVFEPYRGGESHFLFLSTLRAYRWLFGIHRFIVERYQFGRNNPEGVESGAYWFYYRLGFRSMRADLAERAEEEWRRLQTERGRTTPRETLVAFTEAHMELRLPDCPPGYDYVDPADLSWAATRIAAARFNGDRKRFARWAERRTRAALGFEGRLSARERGALSAVAPAIALIPDLDDWSAPERGLARDWVLARSAPQELAFFDILSRHERLAAGLKAVAGLRA